MTTSKYGELERLDAWGAIEDRNVQKINEGYKMWGAFRDGRKLKRVAFSMEMIPWLYRARFYSKKWKATSSLQAPFHDHMRYFVNKDTKQRIFTIQPYLWDVALEEGIHGIQQDFECEPLTLPKEFQDIYHECINARPKYVPLPNSPIVNETIDAILDKARSVSQVFAEKHGLYVEVSFNGWYNPQQTILIEYRRKEAERVACDQRILTEKFKVLRAMGFSSAP